MQNYIPICDALKSHIARMSNAASKQQEPDYIADLVLDFTNDLYKIISLNSEFIYNVTGVFCHQKPKVKVPSVLVKNICELGDLLFIYKQTDLSGISMYNALLYQAKMFGNKVTGVQKDLYDKWPDFHFIHKPFNSLGTLSISPPPYSGAKYLELNNYNCHVTNCPCCWNNLYFFCNELNYFFNFTAGKQFYDLGDSNYSDWDKMIWALIKNLNNTQAKRKNFRNNSFNRVNSQGMILYCSEYGNTSSSLISSICNENDIDHNEFFGIPTIVVEATQREYHNRD